MSADRSHVYEWMGTACVNCGLTSAEIGERGLTSCRAYVPDRFDRADDFAHVWEQVQLSAKAK